MPATARRLQAAEKQAAPIVFYHEAAGVEKLAELKRLYDFDEYVKKGEDEFERMALLMQWTFDNVRYGGAKQYTELRNALTILKKAKEGTPFWCGNISAVYMQCSLALGWTSRYVLMRNPKGEGHISNDVWSNQFRKWVMIDATWNVYIEKAGIPLSFIEIRDEWIKNQGADLVYVYGAGDQERRYTKDQLPIRHPTNYLYKFWPVTKDWISLTYEMGFVGRNSLFTTADGSGAHIWETIYTVKPEGGDKNWDLNHYPSPSREALFHELNAVEISVKEADGKRGSYEIGFDAFSNGNYAPNFESYEYRIDGGDWNDAKGPVTVRTGWGRHEVEARIRNKFGVRGPVYSKPLR